MALSIGVSVGSRIKIGNSLLRVKAITAANLIVVVVDNQPEVVISEHAQVQILPGVMVQVGMGPGGGSGNRLAFEADRSIRISRIEKDRGRPHGDHA